MPPTMRPGGSATRRMRDSAVTLLPQPDSPTIASVSPRAEREGHAVDGLDEAAARVEVGLQVLDLEHALVGRRRWRMLSSAAEGHAAI